MKKIFMLTIFTLLAFNTFAAPPTTTKSFSAKATVGQLLNITQNQLLNFGVIYVNPTQSGTVVLPVSGSISSAVHNLAGGESVGRYTITGDANAGVSIDINNYGTISSGSNSLNLTYTPSVTSATLDSNGTANLVVGGTLVLPSTTPSGVYNGYFNIWVSYQ